MGKTKIVIVIGVLVVLLGGYYFYLSNYKMPEEETVITKVQEVLLKNLDTDYPPTPREVIKYYSEITKCLYNETYTEEQFEQMADRLLLLYDSDLAANNPREQYLIDLKKDVKDFLDKGYSIVKYTTSTSTDVDFYSHEGRECAKLYCTYSIKSGADYKSSQQVFVLRKDTDDGHWKILGFDIVTPEN